MNRELRLSPASLLTGLGLVFLLALRAHGATPLEVSAVASSEKQATASFEQELQVFLLAVQAPQNTIRDLAEPLYHQVILRESKPDRLFERLSQMAAATDRPLRQRARLWLAASHLHWRHGQRQMALDAAEAAVNLDASLEHVLQRADLLDAAGDIDKARQVYRQALTLIGDEQADHQQHRANIRLRLALMQTGKKETDNLVSFALSQGDPAYRNRAAVALALQGHYTAALDLFEVVSSLDKVAFAQRIATVDWAIRAGDAGRAQALAWEAVQNAAIASDRRYGLSLLVEAHRLDDSLERLLGHFKQQAASPAGLSAEARQVWVDLLQDAGQLQQALALVKETSLDKLKPQQWRQHLALYRQSDEIETLEREYRRQITAQPTQTQAVAALTEYYLSSERPDKAEQLWQDFLRRNAGNGTVLLAGARAMAPMGFDSLAIASLEHFIQNNPETMPLLLFLFERHWQQGRGSEAEAVLTRLDALLPKSSPRRAELADAWLQLGRPQHALTTWERLARSREQETGEGLAPEDSMRLAWLHGQLNNGEKALSLWRSLWRRTISPARRAVVQDQLLELATEENQLESMAAELAATLSEGNAERYEIDLLVALYLQLEDRPSAVAAIAEYFSSAASRDKDSDPSARLREQADAYLQLGDYPRYQQINQRLAKLDPHNQAEYLRNQLMGLMEQGEPELGAVQRLLAQLHEHAGEEAWAFEAGILAALDRPVESAVAFRRAIAYQPEYGDNYLMLGKMLKLSGRGEDAIAVFQSLAQGAADDNQFVVAIDGILNAVNLSFNSRYGPDQIGLQRLNWAERMILERLTAGGEKGYLYQLLADVVEAQGSGGGQLAVMETVLAGASGRRDGILKELMLLTEDVDPQRQLDLGRRLLALNLELPLDTYLSLGKAFLARQELNSALRVFERAANDFNSADVMLEVANILREYAHFQVALDYAIRAFHLDRDSIAVLHTLATLREFAGQQEMAHRTYFNALDLLLRKQPFEAPGQDRDTPAMYELKQHVEPLLLGLLSTWPADPALQATRLGSLEAAVEAALEPVAGAVNNASQLGHYPRLKAWLQVTRRVAFARRHPQLADRLDAKILSAFGGDSQFAHTVISDRLSWGLYNSAAALAARLPEQTRPPLAVANPDLSPSTLLNLGVANGDSSDRRALVRAWAEAGFVGEAVQWAKTYLDATDYRGFCRDMVERVRTTNNQELIEVLSVTPDFLSLLARATGEAPVDQARLLAIAKAATASGLEHVWRRRTTMQAALLLSEGLSHDNLLDYLHYLSIATRDVSEQETGFVLYYLLQSLLQRPLNAEHSRQLSQAVISLMNTQPGLQWSRLYYSFARLLTKSLPDKDHVALAESVWDEVYRHAGDVMNYHRPLIYLAGGKTEQALDAFIALNLDAAKREPIVLTRVYGNRSNTFDELIPVFVPAYEAALKERFDAMLSWQGRSLAIAKVRNKLFQEFLSPEQAVDFYSNNEDYLKYLNNIYPRYGVSASQRLPLLEHLSTLDKDNEDYADKLLKELEQADMPLRALQLRKASLKSVGSLAPARAAISNLNPVGRIKLQLTQAVDDDDPGAARLAFRRLWRGTAYMHKRARLPHSALQSTDWVDSSTESPAALFAVLAQFDFGLDEFERYLDTMTVEQRRQAPAIYAYLAQAYQHNGSAAQKVASLSEALESGQADDRDFSLWLAMIDAEAANSDQAAGLSPRVASILGSYFDKVAWLSNHQLRNIARIYAKSGQSSRAVEAYRVLAAKTLNRNFAQRGFRSGRPELTAFDLVDEVSTFLQGRERVGLVQNIVEMSQPPLAEKLLEQSHRLLQIKAWSRVLNAPTALRKLNSVVGAPGAQWSVTNLRAINRLQVKVGQYDAALQSLKYILQQDSISYGRIGNEFVDGDSLEGINDRYLDWMGAEGGGGALFAFGWDAGEWLPRAACALNDWIEQDETEIHPDLALDYMVKIAGRLHELGEKDAVVEVIDDLSARLAAPERYTSKTVTKALAIAAQVGTPLATETMIVLLDARLVPVDQTAAVIERAAARRGAAEALILGEKVAQYTHNDALLAALVSVAEQAGDRARAEHWRKQRREEAAAREKLHALST